MRLANVRPLCPDEPLKAVGLSVGLGNHDACSQGLQLNDRIDRTLSTTEDAHFFWHSTVDEAPSCLPSHASVTELATRG